MRIKRDRMNPKHGDLSTDEKNSFYLGRHIVRNGDRPQRFFRSPDPMMEFYHQNIDAFRSIGVDVDKGVVVNGCFRSNKAILQRMMEPEVETEFTGYPSMSLIKKKDKAIKAVIRKLDIKQLCECEKEDMKYSRFDLSTYPGFMYSEYLGMKTKAEALEIANNAAVRRWENIDKATKDGEPVKRRELYPSTYVVGARNKKDLTYEDNEVITSRSVHMPDFHCEIHTAPWIDQISDHIKDEERGCIYIGNSYVKSDRLYNDLKDADSILEGDVKRFDSSLYINDIIIANSLARLYYDHESEAIDNHFLAILDTIAIKDYYTPGGYLYRLIHGLPSGVKPTSLYGSFINLVNLCHSCSDWSLKQIRFIVGGDDFLIAFNFMISNRDLNRIKEYSSKIGIIFKMLDMKDLRSKRSDDRPTFYKYTFDNGDPIVPAKAVLERVFLPYNKRYKSDFEVLTFLNELVPSLAAPRSHLILFYKFYQIMYAKVSKREIKLSEVISMHFGIYNKVMSGKILPHSKTHDYRTFLCAKAIPSVGGLDHELRKMFFMKSKKDTLLYPSFVKNKVKISHIILR